MKTFSIIIRVSKEQRDKIKRKAEAMGLSVSDFLRILGLNSNIKKYLSQ